MRTYRESLRRGAVVPTVSKGGAQATAFPLALPTPPILPTPSAFPMPFSAEAMPPSPALPFIANDMNRIGSLASPELVTQFQVRPKGQGGEQPAGIIFLPGPLPFLPPIPILTPLVQGG